MKTKLIACVILVLPIASLAADLAPASAQYSTEGAAPVAPAAPRVLPRTVWPRVELLDGRVLERARANAEDAATVTFLHAGGVAKIDKRLLPADLAAVFTFDAQAAAREAARNAQAARIAAAHNQARRAEAELQAATRPRVQPRADAAGAVSDVQAGRDAQSRADRIHAAAELRAGTYFENEKRSGSGATLVFGIRCEHDEPTQVVGWDNRWETTGTAYYNVYDSVGWGSFSSRKKRFRAFVELAPGRAAKVIDFEER